MIDQASYELIERYLDDALSVSEKQAFEARLDSEPELQATIDQVKDVHFLVELGSEHEILQRIKEADPARQQKQGRVRLFSPYWAVGLAAAVALLFFLFRPEPGFDHEKAFEANFAPYRIVGTSRSDGTENQWTQITRAYEQENWDEVIRQVDLLPDQDSYLTYFYLGMANLAKGQTDLAVQAFEQVMQYDHDMKQQTLWYLALSHLRANQIPEAIQNLELLQSLGKYQGPAVAALLEQLKKASSP